MLSLLNKKTEQQIVAEIHNEFDTAEDRLLKQAEMLLTELNIPTESSIEKKAETLKSLGFVNSETVKQAEKLSTTRKKEEERLVATKELAETIQYYKQNYPFQKFLTESELERICKKYNLVFAPVANYIKDVPEKNINEINKCPSLKPKDNPTNIYIHTISKLKNRISNVKIKTTENDGHLGANSLLKKYKINESSEYNSINVETVTIKRDGLFIAAPKLHFKLNGLLNKKYGFFNFTVEHKDPIVFRYCRSGVQVLSKWGLEASDELLINEKLN